MKNVWIINQYITTPEIDGDGYRHYYIAKHLKKSDYNTLLITSSFAHAPYRHTKFTGLYKFVNKGIPTLILKGNKYGKSEGFGRILSWIIFWLVLFIVPMISKKKVPRPDIIVLSSLPLLPILNVQFFKWLYPKSKFVFEIRDLWPLSAIELGGYSKNDFSMKVLAGLEKMAYRKADLIISVIPRADLHVKKVLGHSNFKFVWITNGYEIPEKSVKYNLKDVLDENINEKYFNIGYSGTLVVANPLDTIITTVGTHSNRNIHLYILGGGPERERILEISKNYDNVHILNHIPKKYVSEFLLKMNLLFMGKGKKDTNIYKYGTSQLKTFDYFYAKKPIIQELNSTEDSVTYSGAGYVIEPENEGALLEKINYFMGLDETALNNYGLKGYNYLINNCTYEKISEKIRDEFEKL